jgi:hypothetical protein
LAGAPAGDARAERRRPIVHAAVLRRARCRARLRA